MEIVYYPDLFISSEKLLKSFLLCWGKVLTVVPPNHIENMKEQANFPLEMYNEIIDLAGEKIIDFLIIRNEERTRASEHMFDLINTWNRDTKFYDSLKIHSLDDLMGRTLECYWFLHKKVEHELVELMLEEKLVMNWAAGEIVALPKVGKSYMGIIAEEIKRSRNVRLVTDDEFLIAAKAGADLERSDIEKGKKHYQLVSLASPQIFISEELLESLSWKEVIKIRKNLLPYTEAFHQEVEQYQNSINLMVDADKEDEAFNEFCVFCERVAVSFRPLSKEAGKLLKITTSSDGFGLINGIILPTIKLVAPDPGLIKICDIAAVSSTISKYSLSKSSKLLGFEYLENLSRSLNVERLKKMVTCLIPKSIRKSK
jgi:hypothetical protein